MAPDVIWNLTNMARLVSIIALWACVARMVSFLWIYKKVVMVIRKKVDVVAPPIFWTFAYHVVVTAMFVVMSVTRIQLIARNEAANTGTFVMPVLAILMLVVINQFYVHYVRILREQAV